MLGSNSLDFLRNNPQFQQLRQVVQQQPQMLEPILQQVGAGNPQLAQLITNHPEQFLQLLAEDAETAAIHAAALETANTTRRDLMTTAIAEARAIVAALPDQPASIVRGAKRGFCTPVAAWLRGPLEELTRDLLAPERVSRQGHLAPAPVSALLERHLARREDLGRPLWALIAFGLWHDAWAGAPARLQTPEPILRAAA